jgi:fumarate hydratase class I
VAEEPGLRLSILPKGCGSENMSALMMLPPSAGLEGVSDFVAEKVRTAGPNPCPPGIIGVGIGGTMEQAALLSKKALLRPVDRHNPRHDLSDLERRLLTRINDLGIGPQGLGGDTTALFAAVEAFPCHIASLPVAVNIQCHAARHAEARFVHGRWSTERAGDITNNKVKGHSNALSSLLEVAKPLKLPLEREKLADLKAGDWVKLSGKMLTGRDQTHRRLCQLMDQGKPLPVDLRGQFIYYVGPSPAPPGHVTGSAGPTTSYRMDAYTSRILSQGVSGMMGKGKRSGEVVQAIKEHGACYLATIGGAGAFLSTCIKRCRLAAFEDLGPEAMYELEVQNFPAIVINDSQGRDYYEMLLAT